MSYYLAGCLFLAQLFPLSPVRLAIYNRPQAAATMSLTNGLIAHWKLDEVSTGVTTNRQDSHGTNLLWDVNTVASATGMLGNAADLETSNSEWFNAHTNNANFILSGDQAFTFSLWFKAESYSGQNFRTLLGKAGGSTFEYMLTVDTVNQQIELQLSTDGTNAVQVEQAFPTNMVWNFVIAWRDPDLDKLCIQLNNGTPTELSYAGTNYIGTGLFRLGSNPNVANWRWDGMLDSVSFWKRVLTADERNRIWNGGAGLDYPLPAP